MAAIQFDPQRFGDDELMELGLDQLRALCRSLHLIGDDEKPQTKTCVKHLLGWRANNAPSASDENASKKLEAKPKQPVGEAAAVPFDLQGVGEAQLMELSLDALRELCRARGLIGGDERPQTKTCVKHLLGWKASSAPSKPSKPTNVEATDSTSSELGKESSTPAAALHAGVRWTDDARAPYPPLKAGGFTEVSVRALAKHCADSSVSWCGQTFESTQWAAKVSQWEALFPNLVCKQGKTKCTPNETEAERTSATTSEANISACWQMLNANDPCIPPKWRDRFKVDTHTRWVHLRTRTPFATHSHTVCKGLSLTWATAKRGSSVRAAFGTPF